MKLKISDGSAAPLAFAALTARVTLGVLLGGRIACAGWLAALLGGVFALPLAIAAARLRAACERSPIEDALENHASPLARLPVLLLAATAAVDSSFVLASASHTAEYLSQGTPPSSLLFGSQLLLCLWSVCKGGDAMGSAARLWRRLMVVLLLLVVVLECKSYRPAWLMPIFGSGADALLSESIRVAGWLSLSVGLFLLSEKEPAHPERSLRPVALFVAAALLSSALIAAQGMMTPPLLFGDLATQYLHYDTLLTNGRASLALQFPLVLICFTGLFLLMLYDAFLSAAMLQSAFPKLSGGLCAALSVVVSAVLTRLNLSARTAHGLFAAQSLLLSLFIVAFLRRRKEVRHA